jgi:hypothetical protein
MFCFGELPETVEQTFRFVEAFIRLLSATTNCALSKNGAFST